MNRKFTNFSAIIGLILIIALIKTPINTLRVAKDMAAFVWEPIAKHFSACHAPNGINQQIEQYGTLGTYIRSIQGFEKGEGHYAYNNRHYQNNHNRGGKSSIYTAGAANQEISKYKLLIPLILLCLFGAYWTNRKK